MKIFYLQFPRIETILVCLCGLITSCESSTQKETYYERLYADSLFIICEGDLNIPGIIDQQESAYMKAYRRMTRHLRYKDSLLWDFTAKEIKVSEDVYNYLTECWRHDNSLLGGNNPVIHGKFVLKLVSDGYIVLPLQKYKQ